MQRRVVVALVLGSLIAVACDRSPVSRTPSAPVDIAQFSDRRFDAALRGLLTSQLPPSSVEVVVSYDPGATTRTAVTQALLQLGAGVLEFKHLPMAAAIATPAQVAGFSSIPGLRSVALNRRLSWLEHASLIATPLPLHESVPSIRANEVHEAGYDGTGVGIAIIDTGIDGLYNADVAYPSKTVQNVKVVSNLADLVSFEDPTGGTIRQAAAIFAENLPNSETSTGHGTHVAGIAAGLGSSSAGYYTGVAPGAKLIGISTGDALLVIWALAGFDWVLEHHVQYNIKVVNNSWGTTGTFDANDPINIGSKALHDAGVTVVFAAGNEGPDNNTLNPYSVAPWVIGVAAACKLGVVDPTNSASQCGDPTGQGRAPLVANFSSRGIPGDELYRPSIAAPGVRIVSTRASTGTVMNALDAPSDVGPTGTCNISLLRALYYTCASGTSMATPHIVGVVALLQQAAGGALTPGQVRGLLMSTAVAMPGYLAHEVGAGYVDAFAAVMAAHTP
jgi:serine protease AprX